MTGTTTAGDTLRQNSDRLYADGNIHRQIEDIATILDNLAAHVDDLIAHHQIKLENDTLEAAGEKPWMCATCGIDAGWPCASRIKADEMHAILHPGRDNTTTPPSRRGTTNRPATTRAPWTPEQVEHLRSWQTDNHVPTYTCPNRDEHTHQDRYGDLGGLEPTVDGWTCPDCTYTQQWAHQIATEHDINE